jgi:hypothetical protein
MELLLACLPYLACLSLRPRLAVRTVRAFGSAFHHEEQQPRVWQLRRGGRKDEVSAL